MSKQKRKKIKISDTITQYVFGNQSWIDISNLGDTEIKYLSNHFQIDEQDLVDVLPPIRRPRLTKRKNYLFLILLFPVYSDTEKTFIPTEVDFFIFKNTLITIHNRSLTPFVRLVDEFEKAIKQQKGSHRFPISPGTNLHHMLDHLYDYCIPLSDQLSDEIDALEKNIFHPNSDKPLIQEVFEFERKVVDFRKIMRNHTMIIDHLGIFLPELHKDNLPHGFLEELSSITKHIWTTLESHKEEVEALQRSYESLTSFDLNQIIKRLTVISIVFLPMTLIASIYGMNFRFIPLMNHPLGFWLTSLGLILIGVFSIRYFHKKKWL